MDNSKLFRKNIHKSRAYDQLVRGTALQNIYDRLAPYGYNIEFIYTEDLEDKENFKEGSKYAILRDTKLLDLVKSSPLLSTKKVLKEFTDRTVVIAFNISAMSLTNELQIPDRSKLRTMTNLCGRELLVGYTYAKIKGSGDDIANWKAGVIPPLEEVLPPAVEVLELDPIASYTLKDNIIDLGKKPTNDAVIVGGLKDQTLVDFEVNLALITPSEKVQKELNFILLNSRCSKVSDKSGFVKYEFYKGQKFYMPYKYNLAESTDMKVLGGSKSVRMYGLSETYTITNAPLLSEYTRYRSKSYLDGSNVEVLLKLGVSFEDIYI
jgi:hypothetical protein